MNGRVAKKLRRFAELMTGGLPNRAFSECDPRFGVPCVLYPRCTRAVYKKMKRSYKKVKQAHKGGKNNC